MFNMKVGKNPFLMGCWQVQKGKYILRLEGIKISLENVPDTWGISYRTHVQNKAYG